MFLFKGEICKPYRLIEIDDNPNETNDEWTVSFEQLQAAINAETCLVTWFDNNNTSNNNLSLEQRIHNYHQDILR